ncbi:MAG: hypothetical protein ACE5JN_15840 [Candidatus Methylomirabilia bacterium]
MELGVPYSRLTDAYREIRQVTGLCIRGFAEMTAEDVARLAGLDLEGACRAKVRQHDEPFAVT